MSPEKAFAQAFLSAKKSKGLKYKQISKATGLSPTWLCHIANGRYNIKLNDACKISQAMGISLDGLMLASGNDFVSKEKVRVG